MHHLRAPAAHLPHLRLPRLRGGRHRRGPRGDHAAGRGAGASPAPRPRDARRSRPPSAPPRASCASNAAAFPGGAVPDDPAQLAVLAVKVADVFLPGRRRRAGRRPDAVAVAAAIVRASGEAGRRDGDRAARRAAVRGLAAGHAAPRSRRTSPPTSPAGSCNACCRTFHQHPPAARGEAGAQAAAQGVPAPSAPGPAAGLPAPRLHGRRAACPVLVGGRCTIYEDRPLVCRTYDCRMYAATGVAPDRAEIAAQVRRWRFSYPAAEDRELQDGGARGGALHPRAPASVCRARPRGGSRSASPRWPSPSTRSSCRAPPSVLAAPAGHGAGPDARRRRRQRGALRRRLTPLGRPAYPVGRSPAPAGKSRPRGGVMGKELSILAHDTVDQPPPATGI